MNKSKVGSRRKEAGSDKTGNCCGSRVLVSSNNLVVERLFLLNFITPHTASITDLNILV